MADNSSILAALKGVDPADAMPFGAAATPEGSPTMLSSMLAGVMNIPKHLIDAAKKAPQPGLRREDFTDLPGSAQPGDKLAGAAADTSMALAGAGAPAAEAGAAGIFGGKLAKTANLRQLDEAMRRHAAGFSPEETRLITGWEQNPADSQWRFEIPDNKAALSYMPPNMGDKATGSVASLMSHPEAFKAYPDLQSLRLTLEKDPQASGAYNYTPPRINVNAPDFTKGRSVALHELQHGVQDIEGFTPGANPDWYAGEIEKNIRAKNGPAAFDYDEIKNLANHAYHNTSGEVEARNVETRRDFTPLQRLMQPSWSTQDVPYANQLAIDPVSLAVRSLRGK